MIDTRDPNSGFDSLLDTMTNTVGVLIIVLAVSYLALRDTVNRVDRLDPAPPATVIESYTQLQDDLKRLDKIAEQKEEEWRAIHRDLKLRQDWEGQVRNSNSILTRQLKHDELNQVDIQEITLGLERNRRTHQQLAGEVDRLKQQVRQVKHTLNLQRDIPKPKVTLARVPDPVPAPVGAKRESFLCRYGRVVYYPANRMLKLLYQGITDATGSDLSNLRISDFGSVIKYFDNQKIVWGDLRWRLCVIQRVDQANKTHRDLKAFLEWTTSEVGESLDDIQKRHSLYQQKLAKSAGKSVYAKFYVWGDSFPEYAIAREIVDGYGISAGWVAKEGDAEYVLIVSSTQTDRNKHGDLEPSGPMRMFVPMTTMRVGSGFGGGAGGASSFTPASGGGSVGIMGASSGGDFVD